MRTDLPEGTVTFLLTDIEGSTRMLHRLGSAGYANALAAHRDILRAACARHEGVEVDTQGDAFFMAFPSPEGCALAAAEAQKALHAHPWPEGELLKVRMGIHTGEPQRTDEGYVGIDVHAAARIASSGHGGQVLLSDISAGKSLRTLEQVDISMRDLGQYNLKDLDHPQRLFQLVIPGLPSDFSAPRSLIAPPNNLPTPQTPFIGRESLVTELKDLLLQDDVRLVTLTGPGGTGKSRLGLRTATELLHSFSEGVFFVPLADLQDPDRVIASIGTALKIREELNTPFIQTIASTLADSSMLLLIDNFEQVQSADKDLAALLAATTGLKLLVTSREALNLSGARGFAVPPLSLPDSSSKPDLLECQAYEAIRLFADRARAVRPDFDLTDDNISEVISICQKVDALPLAIELAAARIRTMNPDRLLRALNRRLKVLTGGAADLLSHQKTLRDLIAWSYDLLQEDEQRLWRRLAIFSGGCSFDAAQQVCDLDDEFDVELDSESLIAKSLINLDFGSSVRGIDKLVQNRESQPRLIMLETLRDYALERLKESEDAQELALKHNQWVLELAQQAELEFRGPRLDYWMEQLDREHANIRSCLNRCLHADTPDLETATCLTAILWFYWYQRGLLSEGNSWLELCLGTESNIRPELRAKALLGLASLLRQQNLLTAAEDHCREALELYRNSKDEENIAIALCQLGAILERVGRYDEAQELLSEALPVLRSSENSERLSFALNTLGALEQLRNNLDTAFLYYQESLDIGKNAQDRNAIATALVNMGEIAQAKGNLEEAAELYRQSLTIYGELELKIAIAYCAEVLAGLGVEMGRNEHATQLFGAAEQLREDLNTPLEPFNQERYERDVARLIDKLSSRKFETLWNTGRQMNTAQLLEISLSSGDS